VKHLLFEHQNNIATLKADGELALKLQQDDFRKREGGTTKDKRSLKREIKEQVGAARMGGMCVRFQRCGVGGGVLSGEGR